MKNQFAEIRTYDKQPKEKPLKVILCCLYLLKLVNVKFLDSPSINNYIIELTKKEWDEVRNNFGYGLVNRIEKYNILDHMGDEDSPIIEKIRKETQNISV